MSDASPTPEPPSSKKSEWFWFRIAVSVFFGLLTVALCVVWVRSYWGLNMLCIPWFNSGGVAVLSRPGVLDCVEQLNPTDWKFAYSHGARRAMQPQHQWGWGSDSSIGNARTVVSFPIWFSVLLCTALSASPWLLPSSRFSLRTLLIATTLVAVVLGLLVWAVR